MPYNGIQFKDVIWVPAMMTTKLARPDPVACCTIGAVADCGSYPPSHSFSSGTAFVRVP